MLALLRQRNFGLLWLGGLISVAGDWVMYAALPYFVYTLTGSTIATAGMTAAELAPTVLLGSVAGVFVDRWDRKRVIIVTNVAQAATVASLLFVSQTGSLWLVYAAATIGASLAAFSVPAEGALLPTLVPERDLLPANALNVLNNRIGRLAGLPLGAALLGALGLRGVVIVDCLSFLVAAGLVALIAAPARSNAHTEHHTVADDVAAASSTWLRLWGEWIAGLRIVRRDRAIAVVFVVLGLMTFGGTMIDPLTVAWVRDQLGRGADVYALLMMVHAVTGILGSLVVGLAGRHLAPRALMGWSGLVAGLVNLVKFNVPMLPVAVAGSATAGVTNVISSVGVETLVQRSVPDEYRGRVYGTLEASGGLLSLLGAVVGGVMAEVVGTVVMLDVSSALIILAGIVVLVTVADDRPVAVQVAVPPTGDASVAR
jgi:MFS family permease